MLGFGYFRKKLAARQQAIQGWAESTDGVTTLVWLKRICGADQCSFQGDAATEFREGRRSVWLEIDAELHKEAGEIIRQAEMLDRQQESIDRANEERFGESEYVT